MKKGNEPIVRLAALKIHQYKNVIDGEIQLVNANPQKYRANILGLYGQNGSGKTALIQAVHLLQFALSGTAIPVDFASCINVEAACASFEFVFDIQVGDEAYKAFYTFSIRQEKQAADQIESWPIDQETDKVILFDECLSYAYQNEAGQKINKSRLIDMRETRPDYPFVPVTKYKNFFGNGNEIKTDLMVAKKMALQTARSFIFSSEFFDQLKQQTEQKQTDLEFKRHYQLLSCLRHYGLTNLFVIETTNSGAITFNTLPIRYKKGNYIQGEVGRYMVPMDHPVVLPDEELKRFSFVINNMNIVLQQIVPGLIIGIKDLGPELLKDGESGHRIELTSKKNEKEIPLKNESEGIIKIISILELLIRVYNDPSTTVAIDELDSGIFEYLLGEVLKIISEKGKGQLIFTSHNLRPLETLDWSFVAFTTTNPHKRFIRPSGIKQNNNLRHSYYRDITLGGGKEELYAPTNNAEIAFAFREAGEIDGQ